MLSVTIKDGTALKRIISLLLAIALMFAFAPMSFAAFDPETTELSMKYAILMEAESGSVLFEKNSTDEAYPASTTKIMTCILALENGDLDEMVTVGEEVWRGFSSQSSLMKLSEGETISLRDLLYGLMLVSGNDAAAAIAVHIGGSISGFADMMNAKAAEIGMTGSHFMNPHGVHKEESHNVVTARDMAILTRYCLVESPKSGDFRAIVGSRSHDVDPTNRDKDGYHLENTNKLVHTKEGKDSMEYKGAIGVKTGDTPAAKRCLVAAAERNDTTLIAVLLYDEDNDNRFRVAADLFDYGFSNLVTVPATELGLSKTAEIYVDNCSFEDEGNGMLELSVDLSGQSITGLKSEIERMQNDVANITTTVTCQSGTLSAPVQQGDLVASVTYQYEGKTLFTADAYAARSVMAMVSAEDTPASGNSLMEAPIDDKKDASPWLFWILVLVVILIIILVIAILIARKRRRRRRSRRSSSSYIYRSRR